MLELAWEALEDAGTVPGHLRDRQVGVYTGVMWSEYAGMLAAQPGVLGAHSAPGGDTSVVPARISYSLGLRGPSIAVNTACSSSLVALHMARRALLSGECEMALAGGVNLMCSPSSTVAMSRFGAMAPDGRCKAFDAAADGYVRGEGGGVVILKRLSRAVADGDRIYCTMVGSAVNNDGFSNGLTAPSPVAQEEVVRAACEDAGIDPVEVDFVETHGTGTELGDPIEAGALGAVYGPGRTQPLLLGAVKTNVGHLEAAAGIAGFVKTALSLHHRRIPGNLNFHTPSRHIDFEGLRLAVPTEPQPWPGAPDRTPTAGVSSFGFGGTNCHVLLSGVQETPHWSRAPRPAVGAEHAPGGREDGPVFVYGGQGSQWPGMAAQFMSAPAFARVVRRCDRAFAPHLGGSLAEALTRGRERLTDTAWIQASIFTMQVALTALWEAWGLRPAAVVGQSMGEVAAAYVAGALSLEDAVLVLATRTRLLEQAAGRGAMAVVDLSAEALREHLDGSGDLAVAVVSNPDRTVVSGRAEELTRLRDEVEARGVSFHPVDVDYASHGPQMEPLLGDLESELAGLTPGPTHLPLWSTVTGERIEGSRLDGAYWARNLRERVLFAPVLADLAEAGSRLFLDVNPHPVVQQDEGYLGQPELTAQRFVTVLDENGEKRRAYRTGDIVQRRGDGALRYVGREDHQLKVRGHRLEPEEIEHALRTHPAVLDSVVLLAEGDLLVAHVQADPEAAELDSATLAAHAATVLRPALIPQHFVLHDQLPRTPNGKTDRLALARTPLPEEERHVHFEAPRTEEERLVADVYQQLLGRGEVGRTDDFFASGGHSLVAVRVLHLIEEASGIRIPLHVFMRDASVAAVASLLPQVAGVEDEALAEALAALDSLTEEEAAALLRE